MEEPLLATWLRTERVTRVRAGAPGDDPTTDDALVEASLAGDEDAFARLVERKRDLVFRTAYQQCGSADDARVVAQAVFVAVWRRLSSFDRRRRFDTWLYQVTIHAAIDHHRRSKARRETEFDETFDARTAAGAAQHAGADRQLEAREVQRILDELAAELTEKQRAAFVLREIEGLSTTEVAEILGTTESTVRNHVFQARQVLRDALIARYPEYARGGAAGAAKREPR